MPRARKRVRVERGLYRIADVYWACGVPPGETQARWHKIGRVGIQEARRQRDEFAYKLRNGTAVPASKRRVTVQELADAWTADLDELAAAGELRPRTLDSYKSALRLHVLPTLGSRPVSSIGPDDLVAWHERQRRAGAATWSIRARWVPLRGLLAHGARTGVIPSNPADVLTRRERPKLGPSRNRVLNHLEIQRMVENAHGTAGLIVPMLIFTGLRVSELRGLTWEDIDFEQRSIHVRLQMSRAGQRVSLKTNAARRDVILMDEIALRLRKHRLAARFSGDQDLVIVNSVGRTLDDSRLRKDFAAAATAAEVTGASPHTCRHTFASILIDQGSDVQFVAEQLGHSSTKTTWDTYIHLFRAREHADAARRELDAAFGRMLRAADERSSQTDR
jgi:integrase